MCGIAGFIQSEAPRSADYLRITVRRMIDVLSHRGPDDAGVWVDDDAEVALGHRRLSILDLSLDGHQPMISERGRYVIVFNGEIYNFTEIRAKLDATDNGPRWRGRSDTEVLLAAIDRLGVEAVVRLCIGMFAFAVWDRESRTLILARDRLGEKPLYYGWQKNTFLFGSELKALRSHPAFKAEIDRNALATFMRYGYVPAPRSIYQGIRKLLPGTVLKVRAGDGTESAPVPFWSLLDVARRGLQAPFMGSDQDALQDLESRLSRAVSIQQISDVPLGAFLSGGIDSSTVVALMQAQSSRPVHTFTIGFNHNQYDEAVHAAAVARHLGTDHTELYVNPEDAMAVVMRLPTLYDEPFADPSQIPTFLISNLARGSVTVSLSGDAGDELFGGYNRYVWSGKLFKCPAQLRKLFAAGLTALSPSQWNRIYASFQRLLPRSLNVRMPGDQAHKLASVLSVDSGPAIYWQLVSACKNPDVVVLGGHDTMDLVSAWEEVADLGTPENQMMALDALTYLPDDILCKVDRAAMGVSLETRVPFLDHRVVEFAWSLPLNMKIRNGQGKWILRQLLHKYVPRALIERPKMGFAVPVDAWLRGPLREWAETLLNESRMRQEGYLNSKPIREKWEEHLSGRRNWQYALWNVLMFQTWLSEQG